MDRRVFQVEFTKNKIPQWPCPRCNKSVLKIIEKTFSYEEGADSSKAHTHEAWEFDWVTNRFSCLLKCTNTLCREVVSCVGFGKVEEHMGYDYEGDVTREVVEYFKPLFFYPNLVMMDIPEDTPEEVSKELNLSFASFFYDPNSAGNSTRKAIEALLTSLKIKRYNVVSHKRKPINLHNRIDLLKSKYSNIKNSLKAIKWIGNHGSHSGNSISTAAVMDAYDLMEIALEDLYSKKRHRIEKIAKTVNKRKGPRK